MKLLLSLLFVLCFSSAVYGKEPLKIGVVVDPPFVIKKGSSYSGIAVDLWCEIAKGLDRPYTFIEYCCAATDAPYTSLETKKVDLLIGSLSVTPERFQKADFTLPIFRDKVIAISQIDYFHNTFRFLKLLWISIASLVCIFALFFLFYINLLWYYERFYTNDIPKSYKKGICYLFWVYVVHGQHFEIPRSRTGKFLILVQKGVFYLMLIILNASLISFITISVSRYASPIQALADFEKRKIGAIEDSKAFKVGREAELRVIPFKSLEEGIKALEIGKIEVFLEDFSDAEYYLRKNSKHNLIISSFELSQDIYAFAAPVGSTLLREVNTQILNLRKLNIPQKVCREYLTTGIKNCEL